MGFNQYIVMFSNEHIISVSVVIGIILLVFFLRKFFIKYKSLDFAFRFIMVSLMIIFELGTRGFAHVAYPSKFLEMMPAPLCGHILWLTVIMALSGSSRLHKLIYPIAVTGSLMSFIFLDCNVDFPDPAAFQFFIGHGTFLLLNLYFFFTKKTSRYTIKDLGRSLLLLAAMGAVMSIIVFLKPEINDPYYIINPPSDLMDFKESLGQVGYTSLYMVLITLFQFIIYGVTYLFTFKRQYDDIEKPHFFFVNILDKIKLSKNIRKVILFITLIVFAYLSSLQAFLESSSLYIVCWIFFALSIIVSVMYEVLNNYDTYKEIHVYKAN